MVIKEILKSKFPLIRDVFWEKELNNMFLRIEVNLHDLNEVASISRDISNFLDTIEKDVEYNNYYLDVYSVGTDVPIAWEDLSQHIDQQISVELSEKVNDRWAFTGKLLFANEAKLTIEWNAKGQFRKQDITSDKIKSLKTTAKV